MEFSFSLCLDYTEISFNVNQIRLKYFLVQALASTSLLFLVIIKSLINKIIIARIVHLYAIITPLLIKKVAVQFPLFISNIDL
jgi:hypothetical protein